MDLIKKIKHLFSKKKNVETPDWNDYHANYWFSNNYSSTDVIGRMFKLNKIYKKDRLIDSSMVHYSYSSHSSNMVTSGYNNTAYGYSAFPIPINEIRIKKLTKIYRKDS